MNHRSIAALTLLQKHIHQRDLSELLDKLATLLLTGIHDRTAIGFTDKLPRTGWRNI